MIVVKDTDKLRETIIKSGFTYSDIAQETGYTRAYVSSILSGKRNPNPKIAVNICEILKIKFDDHFFIESVHKTITT